jgi:hypothetical protein
MFTYTPLATITVGAGGASSIAFTSIPATYNDLEIRFSIRSALAGTDAQLRISVNGNAVGNAFSQRGFQGTGTSAASDNSATGWIIGGFNAANTAANIFTNATVYFIDYAAAQYKTYLVHSAMENNTSGSVYQEIRGVMWSNTAAITSLEFTNPTSTFVQYSTATLYGIRNTV